MDYIVAVCRSCKSEKRIYSQGYCKVCFNKNLDISITNRPKKKTRGSIFHVYIHSKLKDSCGFNNNLLSRQDVRTILLRSHIPNICHNDFLCEMEDLGMIKLKDKRNIEIVV